MASPSFIQKAYIAFFNRPADKDGFDFWEGTDDPDQDLLDLFAQSAEYLSDFANKTDKQIIATVYQNLFGRAPETDGLNYWAQMMEEGWVTIGNVAYEILGGAQGKDLTIVDNKTEAAQAFTDALDTTAKAEAYALAGDNGVGNVAKDWLSSVANGPYTPSMNLNLAKAKLGEIVDTLVKANSDEPVDPDPEPADNVYSIDSKATANDTISLTKDNKTNDTIKWDNTFDNGKVTVTNFGYGDDKLDLTAYGAKWVGAATLNNNNYAMWLTGLHPDTVTNSNWKSGSAFPADTLAVGDKYITFTRTAAQAIAETTMYMIELWTVGGALADAYNSIIPSTEVRDVAKLIGYVDLGAEIGSSLVACIDL